MTGIDPWFLDRFVEVIARRAGGPGTAGRRRSRRRASSGAPSEHGFSDEDLAQLTGPTRRRRSARPREAAGVDAGLHPRRHLRRRVRVDDALPLLLLRDGGRGGARAASRRSSSSARGRTGSGRGSSSTTAASTRPKAISAAGYESVMVNCNPETVSTDYDTSDRLYFEPLTFEDVLAVVEREKPLGVLVQFGGQTPLKLAHPLEKAGVRILGTSPEAIDRAEDRERFGELLARRRASRRRRGRRRATAAEGMKAGRALGFPLLVRPSYVLGGRAMRIVYDERGARADPRGGARGLPGPPRPDRPVPRGRLRAGRRRARRRDGRSSSRASCSTSRRPGSTPATRTPSSRRTGASRAERSARSATRRPGSARRSGSSA